VRIVESDPHQNWGTCEVKSSLSAANQAQITFTDDHHAAALGIFNPGAYPKDVEKDVPKAAALAAMFRYSVENMLRVVSEDKERLITTVLGQYGGLIKATGNAPEFNPRVSLSRTEYLVSLYTVLHTLKSFLDVYDQLLAHLILPGQKRHSFGKGPIDGKKLSGGSLIKWLRGSVSSETTYASNLSDVIFAHSTDWITEAVDYRDALGHKGDLRGFVAAHVTFKGISEASKVESVEKPTMPHGEPVDEYCARLLSKLGEFIEETLALLPNVDHALICRDNWPVLYSTIQGESKEE
jgi:hypothetical protein